MKFSLIRWVKNKMKIDKIQATGLCPCSGKCCNNPDIICPDHTCSFEDFCEECFVSRCENCESECCCDL